MLWCERVRISARNDDVADDGIGGNIFEHGVPATKCRLEGIFSNKKSVGSNRVGTRAVAAVERAVRCCFAQYSAFSIEERATARWTKRTEEKTLVVISVHQPFDWRVSPLMQRV